MGVQCFSPNTPDAMPNAHQSEFHPLKPVGREYSGGGDQFHLQENIAHQVHQGEIFLYDEQVVAGRIIASPQSSSCKPALPSQVEPVICTALQYTYPEAMLR